MSRKGAIEILGSPKLKLSSTIGEYLAEPVVCQTSVPEYLFDSCYSAPRLLRVSLLVKLVKRNAAKGRGVFDVLSRVCRSWKLLGSCLEKDQDFRLISLFRKVFRPLGCELDIHVDDEWVSPAEQRDVQGPF